MTSPYHRDRDFDPDHDPGLPSGSRFPGIPGVPGGSRAPRQTWGQRRAERIREQVEKAQRGDHLIPTWMLLVLNIVIIVGCLLGLLLT